MSDEKDIKYNKVESYDVVIKYNVQLFFIQLCKHSNINFPYEV